MIQPLTYNDISFLNRLQPADWRDITAPFKEYTTSDFCFPIKAVINDTIAGIGTSIIHHNVAWLAHIIVHPDNRNQGIGRSITQALTDDARSKNCDTILLIATELGAPVYEKIGFITETEYLFLKDIKTMNANEISKNIVPYTNDFREQLLEIDRQISGEDRGFHLEQYAADGYLYMEDKKVKGFYLPDFGEGLVQATTPEAGIALVKLRLTTKDYISFPIDNTHATTFFYQQGYKEFKTARRMRLGKEISWQAMNLYSRIGGNLG